MKNLRESVISHFSISIFVLLVTNRDTVFLDLDGFARFNVMIFGKEVESYLSYFPPIISAFATLPKSLIVVDGLLLLLGKRPQSDNHL